LRPSIPVACFIISTRSLALKIDNGLLPEYCLKKLSNKSAQYLFQPLEKTPLYLILGSINSNNFSQS
jgi:hypothetical protein